VSVNVFRRYLPICAAPNKVENRNVYGAFAATTPMLAMVSPFFIDGTALMYSTTPLEGAVASWMVLPNQSVT
jgi:hypothetical protein